MPTYPITSKENSRRIRVAIRRVFLDVWDPIGVRHAPNAQDEYDTYLGGIFELLMSKAPDAKLKEYLDWCVDRMGMDSSRHSDADVIQALRAIELTEPSSLVEAAPLA
jgi:hypothetical protein